MMMVLVLMVMVLMAMVVVLMVMVRRVKSRSAMWHIICCIWRVPHFLHFVAKVLAVLPGSISCVDSPWVLDCLMHDKSCFFGGLVECLLQ